MENKQQKAVVISGAGSGIGASTALEFAKQGYFVFLLGRRLEKLEQVLGQIKDLDGRGQALSCDLNQVESVASAWKNIEENNHAEVEVLVNNAGIYNQKTFAECDESDWQSQFNTNIFGCFRLTHAAWKYFTARKKGSIVNISSGLGLRPSARTSMYSASKAAMVSFTQSLALEGGPLGIRSNCVCPGLVDTPIHSFHSQAASEKAASLAKMAGLQPLQRIGNPDEIAKAIYFLAGPDSAWTTGAILTVDGGINLT